MKRSLIDGKPIMQLGDNWYKVSEPDHLGFCEILETIASLEKLKAYEKIIINSSYGASLHF